MPFNDSLELKAKEQTTGHSSGHLALALSSLTINVFHFFPIRKQGFTWFVFYFYSCIFYIDAIKTCKSINGLNEPGPNGQTAGFSSGSGTITKSVLYNYLYL